MIGRIALLLLALVLLPIAAGAQSDPPRLTLYAAFDAQRLAPVLAEFQRHSGIAVTLVSDDPDLLLGRLLSEGAASPADLVLVPALARLERAAVAGLLQPVAQSEIEQAIPAHLRDPQARWFGLAVFARAIAFVSDKVKPGEVTTYADLAKPGIFGRLCLPPATRTSSRALVAAMINQKGEDNTAAWMRAVGANAVKLPIEITAGKPLADGDDRALVRALAAGVCDIAVVGSRSMARLADRGDDADKAALDKLGLVWPNNAGKGTEVDIIGGAVPAASPPTRRETLAKLLAWLASDAGQRLLAESVWAFPAKPGVPLSNPVTRWGPFRSDPTPLHALIPHLSAASRLTDQATWP